MEKIKNLLNPGHGTDDETLYGSGKQTTAGSQGHDISTTGERTENTSTGSGLTGSRATAQDQASSQRYGTDGAIGQGSGLSGSRATGQDSTSTSDTHQSGLTGSRSTGHDTDSTYPNQPSSLTGSRADQVPVMEQTKQQRYGTDGPVGNRGSGLFASGDHTSSNHGQQLHGNNEGLGATTGLSGARESGLERPGANSSAAGTMASNASIKSGVLGQAPTGSDMAQGSTHNSTMPANAGAGGQPTQNSVGSNEQYPSDRSFPLAGGQTTNNPTGPHSGQDSTAFRSGQAQSQASGSHTGRDAGLVGGVGAGGAAIGAQEALRRHENRIQTTELPATTTQSNTPGSPTTRKSPLSGDHDQSRVTPTTTQANVPRSPTSPTSRRSPLSMDESRPQTPVEHARDTAHSHEHSGHGHEYSGDPCTPPHDGVAGVETTPGPHATDTANRLDPQNHGNQHLGSTERDQHHQGRDAALVGGGAAAAAGTAYETSKHHDNRSDPFVEQRSTVAAPHKGGLLDKIIPPKVDNTTNDFHSRHADRHADTKDSHHGNEAAYVGASGTAGAAATTAFRQHDDGKTGSGVVTGERGISGSGSNPYSSHTVDPRVDSAEHRRSMESRTAGPTGSSLGSTQQTRAQDHTGRNAGLAAGGAGAAGLGAYEAVKHHDEPKYAPPTQAGTATTGTAAGYTQPTDQQSTLGRGAAITGGTGAAGVGAYEVGKHHDSSANQHGDQRNIPTRTAQPVGQETTQHTGRNVAGVGAAGAAGLGAEHEFSKKDAEHNAQAAEKAERKHEKELARSRSKQEKEDEKSRKPSLISRILHRNKDDKEDHTPSESHHHKEEAVGSSAGLAAVGTHEHNKLHKDPPKNYRTNDATNTGTHQYNESELQQGGAGQTGHGGSTVIEPHTGLPMDLSKGDGYGGTDGSSNITGAHTTGASSATDWENIKKQNTPY